MGLYHNSKVKEKDAQPWQVFMPHEPQQVRPKESLEDALTRIYGG